MKAVILAAGRGKRMNELTQYNNKCLIEIEEESVLYRNIKHISQLEAIDEIIIVVGYLAKEVMLTIGNECNGKRISYCIQREQRGLINSLEAAKAALKDTSFFLALGDEVIIENNYLKALEDFNEESCKAMIGVVTTNNLDQVKKTYSIRFDNQGNVDELVEKPTVPFNNIVGTGNIFFAKGTIDLIDETPINEIRGEKELVDFLKIIMERSGRVKTFPVGTDYINLNTKEDYLYAVEQIKKGKNVNNSKIPQ